MPSDYFTKREESNKNGKRGYLCTYMNMCEHIVCVCVSVYETERERFSNQPRVRVYTYPGKSMTSLARFICLLMS